ncbi:MAG TPA: hypothetical protein VEL07_08620 [Planctomycetota bacterium]|nr:hypothetical protein [Planctomycetota bacterium]
MSATIAENVERAYAAVRDRVLAIAAAQRRCVVAVGAGRLVWLVGAPLLIAIAAQAAFGMPLIVRALVLPLAVIAALWLAWRGVIRPALKRTTPVAAALLVEHARPGLESRLVSAIETYPDLTAEKPRFHRDLVSALVLRAGADVAAADLDAVVDRRPARRQLTAAALALVAWIAAVASAPGAIGGGFRGLVDAWRDLADHLRGALGAGIAVEPLERAYLAGSDVTVRARLHGFSAAETIVRWRLADDAEWSERTLPVDADGRAALLMPAATQPFTCWFSVGKLVSERVSVVVTERPRIAVLTVEYAAPDYVRRAPEVDSRSDGDLDALYGSTVVLTIEANKPLAGATLAVAGATPIAFSVGDRFANGVLKLDAEAWLASASDVETAYTLALVDEYGFANDDAARAYRLVVRKDQPPTIAFSGLPHSSPAQEPTLLAPDLARVPLIIKASDDQGVARVALHWRLESLLETEAPRSGAGKERSFVSPPRQVSGLSLARLADLGATVGDRIVFWAEAADAYDLGPERAPHIARTPEYRIAVVSREEIMADVMYAGTWTVDLYNRQKQAALAQREKPPRNDPPPEPPGVVQARTIDVSQVDDALSGMDQEVYRAYIGSLDAEGAP